MAEKLENGSYTVGYGKPPPKQKGMLNKRTRLLQKLADPDAQDLPLTPKQVLAHNMAYFQAKGDEILKLISDSRAQGIPISEVGDEITKVIEYKELANACAHKLAPYIHPRLAQVDVKTEQVQPFVIRVPAIEASPDAWAQRVGAPKIIDAEPVK